MSTEPRQTEPSVNRIEIDHPNVSYALETKIPIDGIEGKSVRARIVFPAGFDQDAWEALPKDQRKMDVVAVGKNEILEEVQTKGYPNPTLVYDPYGNGETGGDKLDPEFEQQYAEKGILDRITHVNGNFGEKHGRTFATAVNWGVEYLDADGIGTMTAHSTGAIDVAYGGQYLDPDITVDRINIDKGYFGLGSVTEAILTADFNIVSDTEFDSEGRIILKGPQTDNPNLIHFSQTDNVDWKGAPSKEELYEERQWSNRSEAHATLLRNDSGPRPDIGTVGTVIGGMHAAQAIRENPMSFFQTYFDRGVTDVNFYGPPDDPIVDTDSAKEVASAIGGHFYNLPEGTGHSSQHHAAAGEYYPALHDPDTPGSKVEAMMDQNADALRQRDPVPGYTPQKSDADVRRERQTERWARMGE